MFFVSHLYFDRVKRPSSGWMAVTSITHHYYTITNKFENLHALQRRINTRSLLPDARPSRPILDVKKSLIFKPWGWIHVEIRIYMSVNVYILPTLKLIFCSSSVEYCSLSNRKRFSCVCISWYKHERGWENSKQLCKPETKSRVCITVENSLNASSVYIRLCKHRKKGKGFLLLL